MDGLAAVGAASSIVQLVDFSLNLIIASAREIRGSLSGFSLKDEALEQVYQQMRSILQPVESLADDGRSRTADSSELSDILGAAKSAQKDCNEILSILEQLKLKRGGTKRSWASMVKAFKSMMGRIRLLRSKHD